MKQKRLLEIDFARGLALVVMFLCHVDAKINPYAMGAEGLYGTYPVYENLYSFIVRFTNIPAVVTFFVLAGMSIGIQLYLQEKKGKGISGLFIRGVILVIVQLTIVSLGWWFLYFSASFFVTAGVLIAFGVSFMIMHFVVRYLHAYVIGILGMCMLLAREWYVQVARSEKFNEWYAWGVVLLGLVSWCVVRLSTQFGNFSQSHDGSMLGVLTLNKYPPSVMFCILGIILSALWVLLGRYSLIQRISSGIIYLGKNSLLTYMIHLYVIALLYYILTLFGGIPNNQVPLYTFVMVLVTWAAVTGLVYAIQRMFVFIKK